MRTTSRKLVGSAGPAGLPGVEAIGPDLFSFYRSIGLNLKQLYGQTEAFLYLTAQPDGKTRSDTVGPVMPNVDLRIAENGEVLFKSPGMFVEYFKDASKTAEAKTADGYVKTGDAGFIDAKTGDLKIIDRARDVGRLNDGTLFAPKYLENKLKFYPNIREAVVYGDGRDFVCAMLNIDLIAVGDWAERNDIVYGFGGNDQLLGGDGDDRMFGGLGNDAFIGSAGADFTSGGPGDDRFSADATDRIDPGAPGAVGDLCVINGAGAACPPRQS